MYQFLRAVIGFGVRLWFKFEVVNLPEIDPNKKLIVCANHFSMRDILAIATAYPYKLHFVAKKELKKLKIISWIFEKLGVIFIDRSANDIDAMRKIMAVLKEDQMIGIFPEGTRVKSIDPKNMKVGVGFISYRAKSDVLCAQIQTDYKFRKPLNVVFRDIIKYENYAEMEAKDARIKMAADIFNSIYQTNYSVEEFEK